MTDLFSELEDNVKASALARVAVADKWTSCIALCVFLVCITAIFIAHG